MSIIVRRRFHGRPQDLSLEHAEQNLIGCRIPLRGYDRWKALKIHVSSPIMPPRSFTFLAPSNGNLKANIDIKVLG